MNQTAYAADPVTIAAQKLFRVPYLYPWQRLVIANILDVLRCCETGSAPEPEIEAWAKQIVLLPTGAGKSLCFLLPAVIDRCTAQGTPPRPTIIIYPLLALMADQQRRLSELGIPYALLRGGQTPQEREEALRSIEHGARIIIANPEVLESPRLRKRLCRQRIIHAVIDEAHCAAEWGDTFRPSYLRVADTIRALNIPVVSAFTATASPPVLTRIQEILFNGEAHILHGDTDRPNIRYRVAHACNKTNAVLELTEQYKKPLLVFCRTRARAEHMAHLCAALHGAERVRFYHAGLSKEEKKAAERWFFESTDGIMAATCAYGLGVDKKDIRTVIHLDAPPAPEAYIQEAGRGGRDGSITTAVLVWSPQDTEQAAAADSKQQRVFSEYVSGGTCRRTVLLAAMGETAGVCSGCDVCDGDACSTAADAQRVQRFIRAHQGQYTLTQAAQQAARQLNAERQKNGLIPIWNEPDIKEVIQRLCMERRIAQKKAWYEKELRLYAPSSSEGSSAGAF